MKKSCQFDSTSQAFSLQIGRKIFDFDVERMDYEVSDYEDDSSQSSQTSSADATRLEIASIMGEEFELPQGLAEDADIFKEFFSIATWQSLNPSDRAHLQKFLPTFPENDIYEKNITLKRLFMRENFKFGSPLTTFHNQLQNGHFRPDIAHLRHLMKKAERRQYKEQRKRQCFELLKEVIVGRREILEAAYNSPPGPIKVQRNYFSNNPAVDPVLQRVKKRYFQELAAVRSEVGEYSQSSEDENYQDGAPRTLSKKQKQKLSLLESSLMSTDMTMVVSTLSTKPSGFDLESNVTIFSNPYEINEEQFRKMLIHHKARRMNNEKHPELNVSGITLKDVAIRTQFGQKRFVSKPPSNNSQNQTHSEKHRKRNNGSSGLNQKSKPTVEHGDSEHAQHNAKKMRLTELAVEVDKKSEDSSDDEISSTVLTSEPDKNIDVEYSSPTNIPQNQKLMEKQALEHKIEKKQSNDYIKPTPSVNNELGDGEMASLTDMDGIDVMSLPVTVEEENLKDINYRQTSELMQDTHVSFFSLLRDIICSSANHRMTLEKIEHHLKNWESNPISPLNDWFTLVDEPWTSLLESALSFLSADYPDFQPDDFVPYIEYKSQIRAYQWIGAGRDSDSHLLNLCSHWLDRKDDVYHPTVVEEEHPEEVAEDSVEEMDEARDESSDDYLRPPRCVTNWIVRLSTEEEKKIFQEQERRRFENPHKAFTYRMHGYESVVGPVKGIYNTQTSSSVLKPRGHNLLAQNRPSYVTMLALVRDAAARLPNGEGTRADICTLIRDSQYLDLPAGGENPLQVVVSGALDRLHYEIDACVKYDTKKKLWIYLHRRRSEAEMEKMHQHYQGIAKTMKKPHRKKSSKKLELNENKDKDVLFKDPNENKNKKGKIKQSMTIQPTLKNVDAQIFQTITNEVKESNQKEVNADDQPKSYMAVENQVLEELMALGGSDGYKTINEVTLGLTGMKTEQEESEIELKKKEVLPKMPGQSLLNQDLLNKTANAHIGGMRVLKTKASKPGLINVVPASEKMQQSNSENQNIANQIIKSENRSQEIITSTGKKIIIQTSFAGGRNPVKFVTTNAGQVGPKIISTKQTIGSPAQIQRISTALSKHVVANFSHPQMRSVGTQQQETPLHNIMKTQTAQFVQNSGIIATQMKNLTAGTQFVTATGQKVQIIASSPQNLGHIQSIQLGGNQNIVAQNIQPTAANIQNTTANLLGNIQQVQILTSTGQIITKTLPTASSTAEEKASEGIKMPSAGLKVNSVSGSVTTLRNAITGQQLQMTIAKPAPGKNIKNVKMVSCQSPTSETGGKSGVSLLATSQQKLQPDKREVREPKLLVQKATPQGAKAGAQLLNVSSVQLLNPRTNQGQIQTITKPLITKNNAPILTGVKLVNTQQGVKMVATSSTMVQNPIQSAKATAAISKAPQSLTQQASGAAKIQNRPTQILTMESLLQNAGQLRVSSGGKGSASLIQIPSSSDGVPQFAVVSQGNIISVAGQPRVIQTQHISNVSSNPTTLVTASAANQSKTVVNKGGNPQTGTGVRVGGSLNLTTIAGKPMILASGAKTQAQHQNVILTSQSTGNNQALVLTPQGNVRAQSSPGTVTVVQQGTTQQILLPANFQGGTINLKALQGLQGVKVIPLTGASGQKGRQQVYARIVKGTSQSSPQQPVSESQAEE